MQAATVGPPPVTTPPSLSTAAALTKKDKHGNFHYTLYKINKLGVFFID